MCGAGWRRSRTTRTSRSTRSSDNQSARQVSTQEGAALAAEYDVRFIEASAKTDVNVTEAFQAIAQQVIDRIPKGAARPASRQLSGASKKKKSCAC